MSKTIGIIAEYNPFHTGHAYQIDFLKQKGYKKIAVAMSGSCVQRGEIALLSKFDRAKMAVDYGVSLVCEIPVPYSSLSAERFAMAGVAILKNLGANAICFGSECGDINLIYQLAEFLLSQRYEKCLNDFLKDNIPFAQARQKAILSQFDINPSIISASNDILAIEYVKQCIQLNWSPEFIVLNRKGANYKDTAPKEGFASASYIRNCVANFCFEQAENFVPSSLKSYFLKQLEQANYFTFDAAFEKSVLNTLRKMTAENFYNIPECNKEIAHSFEKAVLCSTDIESLFANLPTKQYTKARLSRIILFAFLNVYDYPQNLPFIRILAMDNNGEEIIKSAAATSLIPIGHSYLNFKKLNHDCEIITRYETSATDTQSTFFKYTALPAKDYTTRLYKK